MIVLSLFDGISVAQIALGKAGIDVEVYYASELDKFPIQVTQSNYPNTIQLGDVTNWRDWDIPTPDLIIGGSPCQGFSFAGKQLNFEDPRSKLFFEFAAIVNHYSPKYFLLENVKMKKEYQQVISETMGIEPIEINSALLSAQNRKRLYWTNIPGVEQPEDRGVTWGAVREAGVDKTNFYYTEKGLSWLARHSLRKGKTLTIHKNDEKMQMIEASHSKNYSSQRFFGICDTPQSSEAIGSLRGRRIDPATLKRADSRRDIPPVQHVEFRYDGKSNCLSTVGKDNVVVPFTLPNRIPQDSFFFRYITPLECERLQTVPDGYTDCVSNTQRYRALGNSFTADVIAHILSFIPKGDAQ